MISSENRYILNRMNNKAQKVGLGDLIHQNKSAVLAIWNFAVQGGAIGDITLVDSDGNNVVLPNKAVVTNVLVDTITGVTSGGAGTIALKANAAGDLLGTTAKTSVAAAGLVAGIPVGTAATAVKMTADRTLKMTVATAALTAGKIAFLVEYHLSI
jgi:hypothetical protein